MAEKKQESSGFKVTDRRAFTSDGELRAEGQEEDQETAEAVAPTPVAEDSDAQQKTVPDNAPVATAAPERDMPAPPTSAEQEAQAAAYRESSKELDNQVAMSGHSAKEFEVTFERFLASLYMTAMLQLGLMRQQNEEPRIDIIGARQTIDTLSLLGGKTKGNLTPAEENFLQNSLYELRMAYVEVTNALARPPQPGPATGTTGR
jgi:hypothetical protein